MALNEAQKKERADYTEIFTKAIGLMARETVMAK